MGNTVYNCLIIISVFYISLLEKYMCNMCIRCSCDISVTGIIIIINCHAKLSKTNERFFDSLMLDEYKDVQELILSKNELIDIPTDSFKDLKQLKKLDLSDNLMIAIHTDVFTKLKNLEDINYSNNHIAIFDSVILEKVPSITTLNLSCNFINVLETTIQNNVVNLVTLDLSHNNLTSIDAVFFKQLLNLQCLNMSHNQIITVSEDIFSQLHHLKILMINNNHLTSLNFNKSPTNLNELNCAFNKITKVSHGLQNIQILNIEFNSISQLEINSTSLKAVVYLNISGNMLTKFPNLKFTELKVLDVSNNNFTVIPEYISSENYPMLDKLYISGNPIKNFKFYSKLKLRLFVARNINSIETLNEDAFIKLEARETECINFTISDNKRLVFVHEKVFDHTNTCFVDLSNNKLKYISPKIILSNDSLRIPNGVNLQGNPFNCNCSLQWMLDNFIPQLYVINPSLLDNLRCQTPAILSDKRMVHWYKWEKRMFCDDMSKLEKFSLEPTVQVNAVSDVKVMFESSSGLYIVLGTCIILLTILVVVGMFFTQKLDMRRSRRNRRF